MGPGGWACWQPVGRRCEGLGEGMVVDLAGPWPGLCDPE